MCEGKLVIPDFVMNVFSEEHLSVVREAHLNYQKFLFVIHRCEETIGYDIEGRPKAAIKVEFRCIGVETD